MLEVAELATDMGARLAGAPPGRVRSVHTNSREVRPGGLFFALRGSTSDGHAYIDDAISQGASAVVCERLPATLAEGCSYLVVAGTWDALFAAARGRLLRVGAAVVGVTGSTGKTTTKELTAAALGGLGVLRTAGNLNTETGVPMTLLGLEAGHRVAVLEMGMSAPGEIARLCRLAPPSVGIVTNVGVAHYEFLRSRSAIAAAKAELVEALDPEGTAVLCADDRLVRAMAARTQARVLTFGRAQAATFRVTWIGVSDDLRVEARLRIPAGAVRLTLSWPSVAAVVDAAAALATAGVFGVAPEEAAARMAGSEPLPGRGGLRRGRRDSLILDDAYNSSPDSLAAALRTLRLVAHGRPAIAVVGDMFELGGLTRRSHLQAGRLAARSGCDILVAVGRFAALVAQGAREAGMPEGRVMMARDAEEAAAALQHLPRGAVVLVKGSRGVGLDHTVERLAEPAR